MGTWGNLPWGNDGAADWFGELFDKTELADQVEEALQLDADDGYEEIRAAAAVVLLLGHNFVWPVEKLDDHLELAASKLEELTKLDVYEESPEIIQTIKAEIKVLRGRL